MSQSKTQPQPQARRNPRACEPCRARKSRCLGGQPCVLCKGLGEEAKCHVRLKARSSRKSVSGTSDTQPTAATATATTAALATSVSVSEDGHVRQSSPSSSKSPLAGFPLPLNIPFTDRQPPDPVSEQLGYSQKSHEVDREDCSQCVRMVEGMMLDWANESGINPANLDLVFRDERMFRADPTFSLDRTTESNLMAFYVKSPERHFDVTDRQMVRSLHERYLVLPRSLSEEQRALVFACLCRSSQLHGDSMIQTGAQYFARAWQELQLWDRPSLMAIGAGLLLAFVAMWRGGRHETQSVLQLVTDNVRSMGLLKRRTASLYPASDQIGRLLTATIYLDTIVAGLCDTLPHILKDEIDWDPSPEALVLEWPLRIMGMESDYHLHPTVRGHFQDIAFILGEETKWLKAAQTILRSIVRPTSSCNEPPALGTTLNWTAMRVYWLLLMLRVPLLDHPLLGGSSWVMTIRAAIQIIRLYNEHHSTGNLHPSWISMLRIITCCQIIIVSCSKGHLHVSEAEELVKTGIKLMECHDNTWPHARSAARGFSFALGTLSGTTQTSGSGSGAHSVSPDLSTSPAWSVGPVLSAAVAPIALSGNQGLTATLGPDWQSVLAEQSTDVWSSLFGDVGPVLDTTQTSGMDWLP